MSKAFTELLEHQRQTEALAAISGRLGWDQETVMPRGSAPQRAEEFGAIEAVLHARRSDPRLGELIEQAAADELDAVAQANIRHIRRSFERATRVPADLATELAKTVSASQGIWAAARSEEDFEAFAPMLERVIGLRQQEAEALRLDGQSRYDALVQDYEPGSSEMALGDMLSAMRPRLVALREAIAGSSVSYDAIKGEFDEALQLDLSQEIAGAFGYDFSHGRIDRAVHPFSSGSGLDVRITTRTSLTDPFNCVYSTIHEVGHACYELGINREFVLTPLGSGVSMGVHESQSRIYENQLGRGRAYCGHLYQRMSDKFGQLSVADADAFYGAVNNVSSGFIRTEADEVHYNLHILMRFDLERALLSGDLPARDLPGAWNDRFAHDFQVEVDKPSNGCLQDVHWSLGLFGYFPTYSLGNVYAGCLMKALAENLPDIDHHLAKGDPLPATNWLRENLQVHGGLYEPEDVIEKACGFAPSVDPLLEYLEAKFGELYRL